jgi:hypothetical protein
MRVLTASAALLLLGWSVAQAQPAAAVPPAPETSKFAINREGSQIGTVTIEVTHNGAETLVKAVTHIQVKIAFYTAYRFEQAYSERWVNNKLVALTSTTDDNGTAYKVDVAPKGTGLAIEANGKISQVDANMFPFTLWNAALVKQTSVFDLQKGAVMKISVADGGMDSIPVLGKKTKAHRYSISGPFAQDVWYDEKGGFVQSMLVGPDGSKIHYRMIPPVEGQ